MNSFQQNATLNRLKKAKFVYSSIPRRKDAKAKFQSVNIKLK